MNIRNYASALAVSGAALAVPAVRAGAPCDGQRPPGQSAPRVISGLAHPIIGLDHFLFVLAIGAACYYFGRGAGTVAMFLAATIAGTVLHLYKATLAYPDAWVALSLILLGILFFAGRALLRSNAALALFGLGGIAHGYAYGEAIVGAEPTPLVAYLAGYTLVQLAVVFGAYAAARYMDRRKPALQAASAVGGALSVAGVAFLAMSIT